MTALALSLGVSPRESVDRVVGLIQAAEQRGVDGIWMIDSQLAMKDAYVALAIAAHHTSTIRLGPGVTNGVTRDETVVANAMATLASVAPGRIDVGFGAGDSAVYPLGRKPLSLAGTRRAVTRLRALLAGESVEGLSRELHLSFRPEPRPPVFLSASQPGMLRLAGEVADGVIIMGPSDPETVRMQMVCVDEGARAAGRDPSEVVRDLWITISVGESALDDVRSWASAQARWLSKWAVVPPSLERFRAELDDAAATYDFTSHLARHAGHARSVSDELARALAVAGDEDECGRRLSELAGLGPDRVTMTLLSGGREHRLDQLTALWHRVGTAH